MLPKAKPGLSGTWAGADRLQPRGTWKTKQKKMVEAWGSMSRYSVQLLICFIAYISNIQFLCWLAGLSGSGSFEN